MEDPSLAQHLTAAVEATGVVDPAKVGLFVEAVAGDFKWGRDDAGRPRVEALSGHPIDRQLSLILLDPRYATFRATPASAGEMTIGLMRAQRAGQTPDASGPLGSYTLGGGGRRNSLTVGPDVSIPGLTRRA